MSTVKFDTWQNGDGTENYKCRAWVNFNGTGTVAIRASGNVSSVTDDGTGLYTVNFTNAMPDTDYSICSTNIGDTAMVIFGIDGVTSTGADVKTTTQLRVRCRNISNTATDIADANVVIFR